MAKANFLGTYSTRGPVGGQNAPGQPKIYWFVWQDSVANTYLIQQLNATYDPTGEPRLLATDKFRREFSREPRVTVLPTLKPDVAEYLSKAFAPGKAQVQSLVTGAVPPQPLKSTTPSPSPALLDREIRADFAKNIMRFRRGNTGAIKEFKRLSTLDEGIVPAHKHMFTDFGMDLRKSKLYDVALGHFKRAVELSPDDSHAQFNMGRILFELGKHAQAATHLEKALALDPTLTYAARLLDRLRQELDGFISKES